MKKLLVSITLVLSIILTLVPQPTVMAACPLAQPAGTIEVLSLNRSYKVGDVFRTNNIGIFVYWARGRYKYYGHKQLRYWADGVEISDGYRFKTIGQKIITVKYRDKKAEFKIQVYPVSIRGSIKEAYVTHGDTQTVYKQNVDVFDPSNVVVHCVYTDGSSQTFYHDDLDFIANGNRIKKGYKFKVVGEKNYVIRLGDYAIKRTLSVIPSFDKVVTRYELISQPEKKVYRVGDGFHICEYTVRCHFEDGTTQDYSGEELYITANGNEMYEQYAFVMPGEKKIVVSIGNFKTTLSLTVI